MRNGVSTWQYSWLDDAPPERVDHEGHASRYSAGWIGHRGCLGVGLSHRGQRCPAQELGVEPLVTRAALAELRKVGVARIAVSLDGPDAQSHDRFRGVSGSFERTLEIIQDAHEVGFPVQVNTTVTRRTLGELPAIEIDRMERLLQTDAALRARLQALEQSDAEIARQYPPERLAQRVRERARLGDRTDSTRAIRVRRLALATGLLLGGRPELFRTPVPKAFRHLGKGRRHELDPLWVRIEVVRILPQATPGEPVEDRGQIVRREQRRRSTAKAPDDSAAGGTASARQ